MNDVRYPFPLVLLRWKDTHADNNLSGWACLGEIEDDGPYIVASTGFLLPSVKAGHVSLAQSLDQEENVDTILHIPVEMVDSVILLSPDASPVSSNPLLVK